MIETRPQKTQERALLIGLEKEGVSKWDLQDSLAELRELANSAGAEVIDTVTQKLQKPTAPYYIGRGKAEYRNARERATSFDRYGAASRRDERREISARRRAGD